MHIGRFVFSELISHLPHKEFQKCVARYRKHCSWRKLSPWDQYLAMAFAQLTYRESLRDVEACLGSVSTKLYHLGFHNPVHRSTLADANESRDCRIFEDFALALIETARALYADDSIGIDLKQGLYALDSTMIDLCLSLFPWAPFRTAKAAIKLHTILDLHGNIPTFIQFSDGKLADVTLLDTIPVEPGAFYVLDRGYLDFGRLYRLNCKAAFFIIRCKDPVVLQRRCSRPVDRSSGLRSDQTAVLTTYKSSRAYPDALRRVSYRDNDTHKSLVFLTNNFDIPALTVAQLYRRRWQIELFFKWIKQHLRIKVFYGTSCNAVKTQIWTAVSVYVLVAIVRKRLKLDLSLYQILQILSLNLFEKTPILQLLQQWHAPTLLPCSAKQLILFDF